MKAHHSSIKSLLAIVLSFTCLMSVAINAAEQSILEGDWKGELKIPTGILGMVIHLSTENGKQLGTMDVPDQGGFGIPMTSVKFDGTQLEFEVDNLSIHYEGKLTASGGELEGTFIQGGVLKLNFTRITNTKSSDTKYILGTWSGIIKIPNQPLTFVVHINEEDGQLIATADSPDQKSYGMKISSISFDKGNLDFTIKPLGVHYSGYLTNDKKLVSGTFEQRDQKLGLELTKGPVAKKKAITDRKPR